MNITFNLNELREQDLRVLSFDDYEKLHKTSDRYYWELFFRPHELEKAFHSSISITSRDLREFLDDIFGIDMGIDSSSNRNRLNEIIKKYAPTKRGQRTKLNYYQFRDMILSDEFNKFILNKHNERQSKNPEKMYQEIMFLQHNKFKETPLYLEQKIKDITYYANALSLIDGIDQILKEFYWSFLDLWKNQEVFYGDIYATKEQKQILDIISYRFRQTSNLVYKFDSKEDIFSHDKHQIIEFFLQDVNRWANNEIK